MSNSTTKERPLAPAQSHDSPSEDAMRDEKTEGASAAKKPWIVSRAWTRSGLNVGTLTMMVKGALPPTISLAIYQSTPVARIYSTLGYLVAIMSVLSFAILPRSKFLQTMLLNIIGVCIGSAIALLQIDCSVQARAHTTTTPPPSSNGPSPGSAVSGYNSSAAAVCAVWLFFNIYLANTIRASRPQLQFPVIMYSIFADVASVYAPSFPTMAAGISFVEGLLEAFLTGFAIATGVSLLIFPTTVRMTFFKQSAGFIHLTQGTLKAQFAYLQSLEKVDIFVPPKEATDYDNEGKLHSHKKRKVAKGIASPEGLNLKAAIEGLGELHGRMHPDIAFAKREMAWGKLDASDISEIYKLMQGIMLPLTGMSSVVDIFQRIAAKWAWAEGDDATSILEPSKKQTAQEIKSQWNGILKSLHDPLKAMTEAMDDGLQHTLYILELAKPPKKQKKTGGGMNDESLPDIEAEAGVMGLGDAGYAKHLERKIEALHEQRKSTLADYCQHGEIRLDANAFVYNHEAATKIHIDHGSLDEETRRRNKRQLYLVLYMEFLLWSTGRAVLELVHFADRKVEDGTVKKSRFIFPKKRRLKRGFLNLLKGANEGTEHTPDVAESGGAGIYSGQSFEAAKDPEHLPPTNVWQRFGNWLRGAGGVLGSIESAFGFRVACATLSIGIVAYLADTRTFFLEQRLVWAMIMVSIGMTITAGSGVFGFIGRITGTFIAMCTSLVIWYIVDGHTAGVIVFLFIFVFIEFYFIMAYPRFIVIALLSIVTQVMIIGYELEVKKVGIKVATSNGQPYYQIELLAPYRLACVSGGMLIAFIWTFFPYPLTARSQLRKDLGASLYLLANFYSIMHNTVGLRVRGQEGDLSKKESPGRKLEKARSEVYVKELGLLAGLRQHSAFTAWEPSLGGKFPRQQYDTIIQETNNILNYLTLISYASKNVAHGTSTSPDRSTWLEDLSRLMGSVSTTSQEITSTLSLLSNSVINGNPLPPYLIAPKPYQLSGKLEELDGDILSISHIAEPGYSAFAVMQIASSLVSDDLGKLIENVRALVGEVDFSFHIISTAESSEEALLNKGKTD